MPFVAAWREQTMGLIFVTMPLSGSLAQRCPVSRNCHLHNSGWVTTRAAGYARDGVLGACTPIAKACVDCGFE
eukprot:15444560-Alexandrium_andersonii.AAC.1